MHDGLQGEVLGGRQLADHVGDVPPGHDEGVADQGRVTTEEGDVHPVVVEQFVVEAGLAPQERAHEAAPGADPLLVGGQVHGDAVGHLGAQRPAVIVPRRERHARMEPTETPDRIEPTQIHDPIDATEANDPIEPIDNAEPVDPIDNTEPFEYTLSTEFSDL